VSRPKITVEAGNANPEIEGYGCTGTLCLGSQDLMVDIETLERNVSNLATYAANLEAVADDSFAAQLRANHGELVKKWQKSVADATNHNKALKDALNKSKTVRIAFQRTAFASVNF